MADNFQMRIDPEDSDQINILQNLLDEKSRTNSVKRAIRFTNKMLLKLNEGYSINAEKEGDKHQIELL